MNVACVSFNSQSLLITWQPPRVDGRNGTIRYGYRVFYELMASDDPAEDQQETTTELTVFLSNLQKFSNNSVQVFLSVRLSGEIEINSRPIRY